MNDKVIRRAKEFCISIIQFVSIKKINHIFMDLPPSSNILHTVLRYVVGRLAAGLLAGEVILVGCREARSLTS